MPVSENDLEPKEDRVRKDFERSYTGPEHVGQQLLAEVVGRAKALREGRAKEIGSGQVFYDGSGPLKIALVSLPIQIDGTDGTLYPRNSERQDMNFCLKEVQFDHFRLCVRDDANRDLRGLASWCERLKKDCLVAVNKGARIVAVNELGYPNFWTGRARNLLEEDLRRELMRLNYSLDACLQRLASRSPGAVIIAGTAHDVASFHNMGPIFFPGRQWTRDHRKLTTAYRVGEYIKPEIDRYYPVYNLGSFTFSVFVCSDAFDLNIFFQQVAVRGTADLRLKPKIIFIPSWHEHVPTRSSSPNARPTSHRMIDAARQLSRSTDAVVVFINQTFCESKHAVFVCGEEQELETEGDISYFEYDETKLKPIRDRTFDVRDQLERLVMRRRVF